MSRVVFNVRRVNK